jgi:hypothetical protein
MDHADVQARLADAALDAGGLDRLAAATSAADVAVTEHLEACGGCRAELEVLRRTVSATRATVRESPSSDLRARTLAYVAESGRVRDGAGAMPTPRRPWFPAAWAASMVATAAVVALLVWGVSSARFDTTEAEIAQQRAAVAGLSVVTDWTLRLAADPDATGIRLGPADDGAATGTVLVSPERGELVMVATGLADAPAGQEYRCWVVKDGERVPIGAMYRAGSIAYWVGEVASLRGLDDGSEFGVSLVGVEQDLDAGRVVLAGPS